MPTPRIEVTAGSPTDEEIAAVTVAILGLATGGEPPAPRRAPAWGRAGRMEATGMAPFTSANDPRLQHRPSGALTPGAV